MRPEPVQLPTLRQLEYVVAVADTGQFSRAARACGVSQPALSRQVREVEGLLGVTLFERTTREVRLTPEGEAIVERARAVLVGAREILDVAALHHGVLQGTVRVGAIPTIAPYLLPFMLPHWRAALPDLRLVFHEAKTEELRAALARGELDVAIVALPYPADGLEVMELFEDPFVLAAPAGHALSGPGPVAADALEHQSLLMMAQGHCLRDHALAACGLGQGPFDTQFQASSLSSLVAMIEAGVGAALVPALALSRELGGDAEVVLRAFSDDPVPARRIGLWWRATSVRGRVFIALAQAMRGAIDGLPGVAEGRVRGGAPKVRDLRIQ